MTEILKGILEDILDVEASEITDDFGPDDAELWDSLNNLRLITAIEEEFEIRFTMEEIESMTDFGKIEKVIQKHIN